jgi:hypothetical protein
MLALDVRLHRVLQERQVRHEGEGKVLSTGRAMADFLAELGNYPIISIEDGMAEDDWDGWKALTDEDRRQGASWLATICSSPTRAPARRHREWKSPTRSWSRSTRSAR